MTQDINILYKKDMSELVKKSDDFPRISREAQELAREEGSATVISVRFGLPKEDYFTIHISNYSADKLNPETQSIPLPVSTLESIADAYKSD